VGGGPVARLTGDRAGRPPRGRQAPGAGWADADELDENVFLLARHRPGRAGRECFCGCTSSTWMRRIIVSF